MGEKEENEEGLVGALHAGKPPGGCAGGARNVEPTP